jgi:hypothetical protein
MRIEQIRLHFELPLGAFDMKIIMHMVWSLSKRTVKAKLKLKIVEKLFNTRRCITTYIIAYLDFPFSGNSKLLTLTP